MAERRLLLLAAFLGSCTPAAPSGQVVARVDGEEITRRDLQVELQSSGAPVDVDLESVQAGLLDQVITRKLLAAEARRTGVDRTATYLAAMRRDREVLLVDALERRAYAISRVPTKADIERFLAENGKAFDLRRTIVVDRIEAAAPDVALSRIEAAASNDEVADLLKAHGQSIRRMQVALDTLEAPAAVIAALEARPPGRPGASYSDGVLRSDAVVSVQPMPVPAEDRAPLAKAMMQRGQVDVWMARDIKRLRAEARIDYQKGFDPGRRQAQPRP